MILETYFQASLFQNSGTAGWMPDGPITMVSVSKYIPYPMDNSGDCLHNLTMRGVIWKTGETAPRKSEFQARSAFKAGSRAADPADRKSDRSFLHVQAYWFREDIMTKGDKLQAYKEKRNFFKTPEPEAVSEKSSRQPIFVIQQHDARRMHFDFRLEVDGVLASWAVPKGPSTDPLEKRLAVRTEDHPLEYADFEGRIPDDEYGGGVVIVWDTGRYENRSHKEENKISVKKALDEGNIRVRLFGKKLQGGYALIHAKMRGDEKNWLLVKEDDDQADARRNPVSAEPESVLSGKTIKEMAEAFGIED